MPKAGTKLGSIVPVLLVLGLVAPGLLGLTVLVVLGLIVFGLNPPPPKRCGAGMASEVATRVRIAASFIIVRIENGLLNVLSCYLVLAEL